MNIYVNGKLETLSDGTTLEGAIRGFGLKKNSIVLELNRKVVDRDRFQTTDLRDNDILEIVHFVGGG